MLTVYSRFEESKPNFKNKAPKFWALVHSNQIV